MPLLITVGAVTTAAVVYKKVKGKDGEEFVSQIDVANMSCVDLLGLEQAMTLFEAPIASVDIFEGDPEEASSYLRARVGEIVAKNPFIGGWLRVDKKSKEIKLHYDEKGDHIVPGLFASFDAGVIHLTKDTPYEQYEALMRDDPVMVKPNTDIIGRDDEPLFRVSIIPDADNPKTRFAMITSMSHMLGDCHTFYQIHRMLGVGTDIVSMNPKRKEDFTDAVTKLMGEKEVKYMKDVSSPSTWEKWMDINSREKLFEKRMFIVSNDWLEAKKRDAAVGSSMSDLSANDIITSWFWKLCNPAVGLMVINFRNRLPMCTDADAGNYHNPIPYLAEDYDTPELIRQSLKGAKRCGTTKKSLPKFSFEDTSFSVSTNWSTFNKGGLQLGGDSGSTSTLHLPLFFASALECMPIKMTLIVLFNAGSDRLGAFIRVPKSVSGDIDSCGIVGETIAMYESTAVDKRLFRACR